MHSDWEVKFGHLGKRVVLLTGETSADLKLIARVLKCPGSLCVINCWNIVLLVG